LLIDAAASPGGYAADITRTSRRGKFTPEQREVDRADAQSAAERAPNQALPGDVSRAAATVIAEASRALG
jgi:Xaa-Pro aminopeptidase